MAFSQTTTPLALLSSTSSNQVHTKGEAYFNQLDGVRFIAVLLVLYDHWLAGYNTLPLGRLGVNIFFVLSGFLITRILLLSKDRYLNQEGGLGLYLKKFYVRRTIRIFPIYYLTILIAFIVNVIPVREKVWWCVLYAVNIYVGHYEHWLGVIDHFWSLAVEEQFYLFFPLVVFFVPIRHFTKILWIFIVGSILLRTYYFVNGNDWIVSFVLMPTCLDAFGFGGLLAYLFVYQFDKFQVIFHHKALLWVGLILLIGLLAVESIFFETQNNPANVIFERLIASIFCFFFIGNAVKGFTGAMKWLLENPASSYLGRISYGIYLYHNFVFNHYHTPATHPVARFMNRVHQHWPTVTNTYLFDFLVYSFLTVILATASWFLIEKPINNLKNKFHY
ncbi:MAG: acyltransferase [Siphonobacter sp.]